MKKCLSFCGKVEPYSEFCRQLRPKWTRVLCVGRLDGGRDRLLHLSPLPAKKKVLG
jgi:hypothetical protein